jgi:hypothetical protein
MEVQRVGNKKLQNVKMNSPKHDHMLEHNFNLLLRSASYFKLCVKGGWELQRHEAGLALPEALLVKGTRLIMKARAKLWEQGSLQAASYSYGN